MEKEVIDFFNKEFPSFFNLDPIKKDTILNKLFLTEDEVYFELVHFFEEFNIDPKNFNILIYFDPEPLTIFHKETWKRFMEKKKSKPLLTIKHLIKVAERKEWFDPE